VNDLVPLQGLASLQTLDCSGTQVNDLTPLQGLASLQTLNCSQTPVSDLAPLQGLASLQTLDCSLTQVNDLAPLQGLASLQSLHCSGCRLASVSETLWLKSTLAELVLYETQIPGVPAEVMSQSPHDDCLESLRAHLQDFNAGREPLSDVRIVVLGNGRSGKTQLSRRLCGQPFRPEWDSTHGIRAAMGSLSAADGGAVVWLNIWDFGGQDIYHGTHALFVPTRAVFVPVWAKDTEPPKAPGEYEHQGISFRNHPLAYWVDYVRHLAHAESPVIIVQTKCDRAADEEPRAPVPDEALKALGFRREIHFSAHNDRGRDELAAALRGAVAWLREREGTAEIGAGRLRVQRRIEGLRDADGALPPDYRLIDQDTFRGWCEEAGGVGSPEHLLAYLHNAGILFYRKGLFRDQIVLDHAWAMNAIYAVFDRTRCYGRLQKEGGRFDRLRLDELI
jgi:internalin A